MEVNDDYVDKSIKYVDFFLATKLFFSFNIFFLLQKYLLKKIISKISFLDE